MNRLPTSSCRLQLGLASNKRFFRGEAVSINDNTVATYLPASPLGCGCLQSLPWMILSRLLLPAFLDQAFACTVVVASRSLSVSFASACRRPAFVFPDAISPSGLLARQCPSVSSLFVARPVSAPSFFVATFLLFLKG